MKRLQQDSIIKILLRLLAIFAKPKCHRSYSGTVVGQQGHYIDVIMTTMASQITSLTVVYSTVYSDADQRKHQSSASLAFVWGIHRDIPRTKGQLRGKYFHLMTSSCDENNYRLPDDDIFPKLSWNYCSMLFFLQNNPLIIHDITVCFIILYDYLRL